MQFDILQEDLTQLNLDDTVWFQWSFKIIICHALYRSMVELSEGVE